METNNYEFERKCMQAALKRVSSLLSLSNIDEIDNIVRLTNCMNSIVCQIRNLDEENVSLFGVDTWTDADCGIDFTVE